MQRSDLPVPRTGIVATHFVVASASHHAGRIPSHTYLDGATECPVMCGHSQPGALSPRRTDRRLFARVRSQYLSRRVSRQVPDRAGA